VARGKEYYRFAGARELTVCLHEREGAGTDGRRLTAGRRRKKGQEMRMRCPTKTIITELVEGSWLADERVAARASLLEPVEVWKL